MSRFNQLWLVLSILLLTTHTAFAERRVALVIGNSAYKHAVRLPNPTNDAAAVSGLFRNLGFEVVSGFDLDRNQMASTINKFGALATGADAAVFFYAGHGISLDGQNYLIPVDADLRNAADVKLGSAMDADIAIDQALSDAKVKIVLLDACRDNPFAQQIAQSGQGTRSASVGSGLSEMKSGKGTLIAFATGPGQVALDGTGLNSPFTKALLRHLPAQGLEIRLAMTNVRAEVATETGQQQTPWENTNLTGFFYLNGEAAVQQQVASLEPGAGGNDEVELEFWRSVKESRNPEELRAYLTRYPNGSFAALARSRLAWVEATPSAQNEIAEQTTLPPFTPDPLVRTAEASLATEDALGLNKETRSAIQKKLRLLGFNIRSSDGNFGTKTRLALSSWQTARGYVSTGYLNKVQHEALLGETASSQAASVDPAPSKNTVSRSASKKPAKKVASKKTTTKKKSSGNARQAGEFLGGVVRGVLGAP